MKINQLKIGTLLSYFQMGLGVVISLVYTPLMIRLLGQSEYGLYNTVASTISMLSVLSLGFNSSYIRFYSKYKITNNDDAICRLNGLFLIVFSVIGVITLLCGGFLSFNLHMVFDTGLTPAEYETAKLLMIMLTINLAVSFITSIFQNIISAHEKFAFLKLVGMAKTVFSPLLTIPLLLMGYKSIAVVAVTLFVSFSVDIIYLTYARKKLRVRFKFKGLEADVFKNLLAFTSFIAVNMVVDQINNNMGKFILGRYQGTSSVAVYSVGYTLYQYYMMFSTAVSGVFTPRIHKLVNSTRCDVNKQKVELTNLFIKVGRIQFLVLALVSSGIIFFGKEFILFWAGTEYGASYYVALLLVLPASIALIQNLGIEIQRAMNKHKFRSLVYIVMAAINLISTVLLCQKYGAIGTALGTAISLVVANGIIMNIYYHRRCNIDIVAFWKSILRLLPGLIVPAVFGLVCRKCLDLSNVLWLIFGIGVYAVAYFLSMWLIGMNTYEKSLLIKPVRKILFKPKTKRTW